MVTKILFGLVCIAYLLDDRSLSDSKKLHHFRQNFADAVEKHQLNVRTTQEIYDQHKHESTYIYIYIYIYVFISTQYQNELPSPNPEQKYFFAEGK